MGGPEGLPGGWIPCGQPEVMVDWEAQWDYQWGWIPCGQPDRRMGPGKCFRHPGCFWPEPAHALDLR